MDYKLSRVDLAMLEFAWSATVALSPAPGKRLELKDACFASGTLIKRGARYFIATVAHYLEAVSLTGMAATFAPKRYTIAKDKEETLRKANSGVFEKDITNCAPINTLWHKCGSDLEDVALIEISFESVPRHNWAYDIDEFVELQGMPKAGEMLLLMGLPRKEALFETVETSADGQEVKQNVVGITENNYRQVQPVKDPEKWTDELDNPRFNPEYHFALYYPTSDKVAPLGLSGGGVWRANEGKLRAGGIIQPYPVLVGIENSYNSVRDCVKATSITRVLQLLDGLKDCARCAARG